MGSFQRLPFVAAVVFGLSNPACGDDCTNVGCSPAAVVRLTQNLADAGTYRITAVADGVEMTCTVTLPGGTGQECTDDRLAVASEGLEGAGGAAATELQNISGFVVLGQYQSLNASVSRDDQVVTEASFALTYADADISGPNCGACPQANETLAVP
jgi:hypothetical protein